MPLHKDLTGADLHAPGAHKTQHENGGSDEISVAGLSGVLADNQPTTIAQITDASAFAQTLLDDANAAAARTTLGVPALAGDTFTGDVIVPDEAYDATGWNGDLSVPTKNAVRDKIESLVVGGGGGVITAIDGATVATDESTSSTSYTDLATAGPAVTLTTGTEVYISISANIYRAASSGQAGHVAVAVSGATTIAAADANGFSTASAAGGANVASSRRFKLTGLTAGSNTFTLKYKTTGGGSTFNYLNRDIVVEAV